MAADQANIVDQAIGWHLRLTEAGERDWADFVAWLEASPVHAAAYDSVAMNDHLLGQAEFPAPAPAPVRAADNDNWRRRRKWLLAGGMAAAAALTAVLLPSSLPRHAGPLTVTTANGERRTLTLQDGTQIELSGGTSIRLDPFDDRVAALDRGEAVFHVRHDADRPFTVTAGGVSVRDVGTVFNIVAAADRMSVAVAEGAVLYRPDHEAITLGAGDTLVRHNASGAIERRRVDAGVVGGWRSGTLSFEGADVGDVAGALTRLYGVDLELERGLSAQPFTGMVRFTGAADRDVPHLAELIGATSRRVGHRWILSPRP